MTVRNTIGMILKPLVTIGALVTITHPNPPNHPVSVGGLRLEKTYSHTPFEQDAFTVRFRNLLHADHTDYIE